MKLKVKLEVITGTTYEQEIDDIPFEMVEWLKEYFTKMDQITDSIRLEDYLALGVTVFINPAHVVSIAIEAV